MHQLAQKLITAGRPARSADDSSRPSRVVSANSGIGSPTRGDGISLGSRPSPMNRTQARGMARTGMRSQRAARIGQASTATGTGSAAETRAGRRPGQMAKAAPATTTAPPTQIQVTSGFTNRRRVIAPLSGS